MFRSIKPIANDGEIERSRSSFGPCGPLGTWKIGGGGISAALAYSPLMAASDAERTFRPGDRTAGAGGKRTGRSVARRGRKPVVRLRANRSAVSTRSDMAVRLPLFSSRTPQVANRKCHNVTACQGYLRRQSAADRIRLSPALSLAELRTARGTTILSDPARDLPIVYIAPCGRVAGP